MKPKVFISHTDKTKLDQDATTAVLVELRRFGIDVWIDRERPPPKTDPSDMEKGPVPDNPWFQHMTNAWSQMDAIIYLVSNAWMEREYCEFEYDPRIMYGSYLDQRDKKRDQLKFYFLVIEDLINPPPTWYDLCDQHIGNVIYLNPFPKTPFGLCTTLSRIIKDINPDYLLPCDISTRLGLRSFINLGNRFRNMPGMVVECDSKLSLDDWLILEDYLGLGSIFLQPVKDIEELQIRYALDSINRMADSIESFGSSISNLYAIWCANLMLRLGGKDRIHDGVDMPIESYFPFIFQSFEPDDNSVFLHCIYLQHGYGLLSSEKPIDSKLAVDFLYAAQLFFKNLGAYPLYALATLLLDHCYVVSPMELKEANSLAQKLNVDPTNNSLHELHHGILDAAFPGPGVMSLPEYRDEVKTWRATQEKALLEGARSGVGFSKRGESKVNEKYWRVVKD